MPKPFLKLRRRMEDMDVSIELACVRLGFGSIGTMQKRLNGGLPWKQEDIVTLGHMLDIPKEEVADYFFPTYDGGPAV